MYTLSWFSQYAQKCHIAQRTLNDEDIEFILKRIAVTDGIHTLTVEHCSSNVFEVVAMVKPKIVIVKEMFITPVAIEHLLSAHPIEIQFRSCSFSESGFDLLAESLGEHSQLKKLCVATCFIKTNDVEVLMKTMCNDPNTTLEELDLSGNISIGVRGVYTALENVPPSLKTLKLDNVVVASGEQYTFPKKPTRLTFFSMLQNEQMSDQSLNELQNWMMDTSPRLEKIFINKILSGEMLGRLIEIAKRHVSFNYINSVQVICDKRLLWHQKVGLALLSTKCVDRFKQQSNPFAKYFPNDCIRTIVDMFRLEHEKKAEAAAAAYLEAMEIEDDLPEVWLEDTTDVDDDDSE